MKEHNNVYKCEISIKIMGISLNKILTISAGDYFKMRNVSGASYEPVGVQAVVPYSESRMIIDFAAKVPREAEAVVDLRVSPSGDERDILIAGTALVLKNG